MTVLTDEDREQLLDKIAWCFACAAVDAVLADPTLLQEITDPTQELDPDERRP